MYYFLEAYEMKTQWEGRVRLCEISVSGTSERIGIRFLIGFILQDILQENFILFRIGRILTLTTC
jgi:hypothetical protein